jgi:rubrerythrin
MIDLWRCEICGDPYIGDNPPDNCPFCGAHKKYIRKAKEAKAVFDVILSDKDKENVTRALSVEVSNSTFYFCAAKQTDDPEGQLLFKALAKIELEHAIIWKKLLKLTDLPKGTDTCFTKNKENLQESHNRETRAIEFYKKAALDSDNNRVKQIFEALVEIETDHLNLSGVRLR